MKVLFVHQNCPAQFKHLVPVLIKHGHNVKALAINHIPIPAGIEVVHYNKLRATTPKFHPSLLDM